MKTELPDATRARDRALSAGRNLQPARAAGIDATLRTPRPDVPTLIEAGYPDLEATVWFALAAPSKMPPAPLSRIAEEVNMVLREPAVIAGLEALGAAPVGGTPE